MAKRRIGGAGGDSNKGTRTAGAALTGAADPDLLDVVAEVAVAFPKP